MVQSAVSPRKSGGAKVWLALYAVLSLTAAAAWVLTAPGAGSQHSPAPTDRGRVTANTEEESASLPVVYDCGRTLLCYVSHHYKAGWTAQEILTILPAHDGLSLLELRDAVRRMGLRADGVRLSSERALADLVNGHGQIVLLATRLTSPEPLGHYICVTGRAQNAFVVVDPPLPVRLIQDDGMREVVALGEGYALVIRPQSTTAE